MTWAASLDDMERMERREGVRQRVIDVIWLPWKEQGWPSPRPCGTPAPPLTQPRSPTPRRSVPQRGREGGPVPCRSYRGTGRSNNPVRSFRPHPAAWTGPGETCCHLFVIQALGMSTLPKRHLCTAAAAGIGSTRSAR